MGHRDRNTGTGFLFSVYACVHGGKDCLGLDTTERIACNYFYFYFLIYSKYKFILFVAFVEGWLPLRCFLQHSRRINYLLSGSFRTTRLAFLEVDNLLDEVFKHACLNWRYRTY